MSDYISRENVLNGRIWVQTSNGVEILHLQAVPVGYIAELLPAQPERPNGHWIFDFAHNEMTCSECGRTFTGGFDLENADNFCRHCGSDNRGKHDEQRKNRNI